MTEIKSGIADNPVFDVQTEQLDQSNELHFLNIDRIEGKLKKYIDTVICGICQGNVENDLRLIKLRLVKFFSTKSDSSTEIGAIAEFICHAYLGYCGFKQEFLYLNLEEGSIKKGFDGHYTKDADLWLFESKSGYSHSKKISHAGKIKEAYDDLVAKISGTTTNDPWLNAYNHSSHLAVGADALITRQLKKLSDDYLLERYQSISNFRIIPSSTIFFEKNWVRGDTESIRTEIAKFLHSFECKSAKVICINKGAKSEFLKYIST